MIFGFFKKKNKDKELLKPVTQQNGSKELLKLVTQQKKNDLPLAISTLKRSFELDKKEKVLTLKQHLRLYPLLQKNGQKDEAFQEFSRLFTYGYPRQGNKPIGTTNNLPVSPFGHDDSLPGYVDYYQQFEEMRVMYEEMTKFFITEKNKNEIAPHFILSQLFNLRGDGWRSKLRERIDPKLVKILDTRSDKESDFYSMMDNYDSDWMTTQQHNINSMSHEGEVMRIMERRTNDDELVKLLTPVLKKSGQLGLIEEILEIFKKHIKVLPTIDTQKVFDDLSSINE